MDSNAWRCLVGSALFAVANVASAQSARFETIGSPPGDVVARTNARIQRAAGELGIGDGWNARATCSFAEGTARCVLESRTGNAATAREMELATSDADADAFASAIAIALTDLWLTAEEAPVNEPLSEQAQFSSPPLPAPDTRHPQTDVVRSGGVSRALRRVDFVITAGPSLETGIRRGIPLYGARVRAAAGVGRWRVGLMASAARGVYSGSERIGTTRFVAGPLFELDVLKASTFALGLNLAAVGYFLRSSIEQRLETDRFRTFAALATLRIEWIVFEGLALELEAGVMRPARRRSVVVDGDEVLRFESVRIVANLGVGYVF